MEEKWVKIKGHEKYEVSSFGRVRKSVNDSFHKPLLGHRTSRGYIEIKISGGHRGVFSVFLVHRLVAEYFIPNPDNLWSVVHINGDNSDNHVWNLKWHGNPEIVRIRQKIKMVSR